MQQYRSIRGLEPVCYRCRMDQKCNEASKWNRKKSAGGNEASKTAGRKRSLEFFLHHPVQPSSRGSRAEPTKNSSSGAKFKQTNPEAAASRVIWVSNRTRLHSRVEKHQWRLTPVVEAKSPDIAMQQRRSISGAKYPNSRIERVAADTVLIPKFRPPAHPGQSDSVRGDAVVLDFTPKVVAARTAGTPMRGGTTGAGFVNLLLRYLGYALRKGE